jgi:hypothetical protein
VHYHLHDSSIIWNTCKWGLTKCLLPPEPHSKCVSGCNYCLTTLNRCRSASLITSEQLGLLDHVQHQHFGSFVTCAWIQDVTVACEACFSFTVSNTSRLTQFQACELLKIKKKTEITHFFKSAPNCLVAEMNEAQWDEGSGRILLDDNTGGGTIMLRPIRFQCAGVCISAGLPCIYIYIYIYTHTHTHTHTHTPRYVYSVEAYV